MSKVSEKVFVVFGSASDTNVYGQIVNGLKEKKVLCTLHVLSAHRTPKPLEKALSKSKAKVFVTGAGLSNALSGVVASQTTCPVIGVPLMGAFGGLDSFLSTIQIPPGIPVLSVGIGCQKDAARHAANIVRGFDGIMLVEHLEDEAREMLQKCADKLESLGIKFEKTKDVSFADTKKLYIDFVALDGLSSLKHSESTVVVVAFKKNSTPSDALLFFENSRHHLFVGLNRAENAAIAACQMAGNAAVRKKILADRKSNAKKVLESDKTENKKFA